MLFTLIFKNLILKFKSSTPFAFCLALLRKMSSLATVDEHKEGI